MSNFDPRYIKRIGIAVETADGELITLYSESPAVEMQIENRIGSELVRGRGDTRVVIVDSSTDITITGIRELHFNNRALGATVQAIENAKAIAGEQPDDHL